jgi:hypothetical protein
VGKHNPNITFLVTLKLCHCVVAAEINKES